MSPIKLTSFCEAKKTINKMMTTYRMEENICKWCNRQGLNFHHIQTAHTTQQQQQQQNSIQKWAEDPNRHFPKEEI